MTQTITIDPVTRIEGHAKVVLELSDGGEVEFAGLVIPELRGFERILVGMEAAEMPLITARICGVCPSAHHLAAVKAVESAFGVDPPPAAKLQRELLYMGHFIHSHAVHLFALAGPDLVLGVRGDAKKRGIAAVAEAAPEVAKKALRLRTLGQKINELLGGRGVHPITAVVGGMAAPMTVEARDSARMMAAESLSLEAELHGVLEGLLDKLLLDMPELVTDKLALPSCYLGTVKDEKVNFYDGLIRIVDESGKKLLDFDVKDYDKYLVERPVDWSYTKPVYLKAAAGVPDGTLYRVSNLARLNCAENMETPGADAALQEFRAQYPRPCHLTFLHLATRLIELQYACENAVRIVEHPDLLKENRVSVKVKAGRGVGHVEAPRGTLIHDFTVDGNGIVREANLLVATQQNFAAINQTILQTVNLFGVKDDALLDGVEFGIRLYDPCLSCATHAVGKMPLEVVVKRDGRVLRHLSRRP